jgi:putative ABC transport system ATP-binding protein
LADAGIACIGVRATSAVSQAVERQNNALSNRVLTASNPERDMSIAEPVLKAEQITKQVSSPEGTLTILAEVNLAIAAGETAAIVGTSGAGKSTLLAVLAGLDEPSSGRVWLNGNDLTALDEDGRAAVRARHVGFVFQSFHLVPSLTALENVMLPLELAGQPNARKSATDALASVGLGTRRTHYPRQLSGGEQQRVAIARAFVARPALLFADEPTGNLDTTTGARVIELLFEMNRAAQTTLVVVTHDLNVAQRCARMIRIEAGRIVADGLAADGRIMAEGLAADPVTANPVVPPQAAAARLAPERVKS